MNILLIMPKMAEYYLDIIRELEYYGHYVDWLSSELSAENDIEDFLNRFTPKRSKRKYYDYVKNIIDRSKVEYEKIILIFGGVYFDSKIFNMLKCRYSNAEFVYYNWDSIKNYPGVLEFYKLFDKAYSFDKNDCNQYGFDFLPLFYSNNYIGTEPIYDYLYITTYSRKKYKNYIHIKKTIPKGLKGYEYILFPNRIKYYISRLLKMSYVTCINRENVHFRPLDRKEVYNLFAKSKVIFDTPLENQNGLTIRTFEALHQKRKLVTTNKNIKYYNFYCDDNIFIVDDDKLQDNEFYKKPFNEDYCLSNDYSIKKFVIKLIGENSVNK